MNVWTIDMTNDIDSILDDVQKICIDIEVFVSYSHSDLHLVRPLLQALTDMDYSIWIDNAVDLGIEWEDHVAKHIYNCTRKGIFVSVIIDQYIDSENCMDELYYAAKLGARIIPVIIGNPKIPNRIQRIISKFQNTFVSSEILDFTLVVDKLNSEVKNLLF